MEKYLSAETISRLIDEARRWAEAYVLEPAHLIQIAIIAAAYVAARVLDSRLSAVLDRLAARQGMDHRIAVALHTLSRLSMPGLWLLVQWIGRAVAARMGWSDWLLDITVSLLAAWLVIRFAAAFIRDPLWSRVVEAVAWTIAALNILDLVEPAIRLLDDLAIQFGTLRLSALLVIKGALSLAVLLWGAVLLSDMLERRIGRSERLTPSVKVLFSKILKALFIAIAVAAALNVIGIDLTGVAVFTGALGLGIGFGLQKVVSNLISGVILLLDRSVKPGDVIAVGNTYGWVNAMSARYVSLITRDGIEHLIPNEDLITQRVENWSYSNNLVRVRIPFGVAYHADPHKVRDIAIAAAATNPRVLKSPAPLCNLKEFGDSSVNFEILVWIDDPANGISNLRGQVLLALWDRLHAENVDIPFPQRDLHLRSAAPITVRVERGESSEPGVPGVPGSAPQVP